MVRNPSSPTDPGVCAISSSSAPVVAGPRHAFALARRHVAAIALAITASWTAPPRTRLLLSSRMQPPRAAAFSIAPGYLDDLFNAEALA